MLTFLKKFSFGGMDIQQVLALKLYYLQQWWDEFGNKYYQSKNVKTISTQMKQTLLKFPEWFSWIHFMPNKIENKHKLEKHHWQNHINQMLQALRLLIILIRTKKMQLKKNIRVGNNRIRYFFIITFLFFFLSIIEIRSEIYFEGNNTDIKVLDKISSKNELIKLINKEEFIYKDLAIKSIKCTDSKFDDNPEIKAYIQVKDLTKKDR